MNYIYVCKLTKTHVDGQIDLAKNVAINFFNVPSDNIEKGINTPIHICHINDLKNFEDIEIQPATNTRWSSKLNTFLSNNGSVLKEGDLLIFEKLLRSYCVRVITDSDKKYDAILDLFEDNEKHMILSSSVDNQAEEKDCAFSLNTPLQQIFYGAPGTGKSYSMKDVIAKHMGVDVKSIDMEADNIFRTTFHPDYDYAQFVGCYKPTKDVEKITYDFMPQVFTNALVKAYKSESQVYLVIEEINRGNCAQIFGDIFQLLDRNGNGESEYSISVDEDLRKYLETNCPESIKEGKIKLPANLSIIATMNTSDQSLFPMDSAFKRRWEWVYVPIKYNNFDKDGNPVQFRIIVEKDKFEYDWNKFQKSVNGYIVNTTHSEDKQMGDYFIKKNVTLDEFVNKVMFYLWNDVCKENYHTEDNFFRTKDEDANEETEFSFGELMTDKANLIIGFMHKLNVDNLIKESSKDEDDSNQG